MLRILPLIALLSMTFEGQVPVSTPEPTAPPKFSLPVAGTVQRQGDAPKFEAAEKDGQWRSGTAAITTALPRGYPRPTAPAEMTLKTYPRLRRAEVRGESMPTLGRNVGFWKLFEHIQKHEIAMTSPVEMEYPGLKSNGESESSAWLMAFLYRTEDMGKVGPDGEVIVADTAPLSVLSLGVQGGYGLDLAKEKLPLLQAQLAKMPELEVAGPVRVLHYNGPDTPSARRWSEVQIPVRVKLIANDLAR